MPEYTYEHPKTKRRIVIFQKMNDPHEYTDKKGVSWNRVWEKPMASIDTKIDEFSESSFEDKTRNKRGTFGDVLDLSKELSEKREAKEGVDPVKQKFYENYAKKRKGKRHPKEIQEKTVKEFDKMGIQFTPD